MKPFLIALLIGLLMATADAALIATNLKCGYWQNPLGVDEAAPRMSWQLQSATANERGQSQTAYEILVASSVGALEKNQGDLCGSGKVISDSSQNETCEVRLEADR